MAPQNQPIAPLILEALNKDVEAGFHEIPTECKNFTAFRNLAEDLILRTILKERLQSTQENPWAIQGEARRLCDLFLRLYAETIWQLSYEQICDSEQLTRPLDKFFVRLLQIPLDSPEVGLLADLMSAPANRDREEETGEEEEGDDDEKLMNEGPKRRYGDAAETATDLQGNGSSTPTKEQEVMAETPGLNSSISIRKGQSKNRGGLNESESAKVDASDKGEDVAAWSNQGNPTRQPCPFDGCARVFENATDCNDHCIKDHLEIS